MNKKQIIELIGSAFSGEVNAKSLEEYLFNKCKYDSDYAKKHLRSSESIIESMNRVAKNVKIYEEEYPYRCDMMELASVLKDGISLSDLGRDTDYNVFEFGLLMYHYDMEKPTAVVFFKFTPDCKVSEIQLSRNKKWFDVIFFDDFEDSPRDTPYTVRPISHREEKRKEKYKITVVKPDYEDLDDDEVYIWRKANEYFRQWLEDEGYKIKESEIFDDSIGYQCVRNSITYTVYMYASSVKGVSPVTGEYCVKLGKRRFSRGFVLVTNLKVERVMRGKAFRYYVGFNEDSRDTVIELWHPHNIMGKDVLVYFPRKEMYDVFDEFMYAFDYESVDAFECSVSDDNPKFIEFEEGKVFENRAFYTRLREIYREYGKMLCGYLSEDGEVYFEVFYIHGYGWFSFTVNGDDLIIELEAHKFDETVIDFLKAEEDVPNWTFKYLASAKSVKVLPPVLTERFAVLVDYDNGETRKYVLPIKDEDEKKEEVIYRDVKLSDAIWKSAELVDSHKSTYGEYPDGGPAIRFSNGLCISTWKCFKLGEKYTEPKKCSYTIYEDDEEELKALWNWSGKDVWDAEEGLLAVFDNKDLYSKHRTTLITTAGDRLTTIDFARLEDAFEGMFRVGIANKGYGFVNTNGEFVTPPKYCSAHGFDGGHAEVYDIHDKDKCLFIDTKGNEITVTGKDGKPYEDVGFFAEGMCAVSTMKLDLDDLAYYSDDASAAGLWGFINEFGEEVIKPQYIFAYRFEKGIAIACKGEWTKEPKWDTDSRKGKYWSEEMLWGGINKAGEAVIPFIFDEINSMNSNKEDETVFKVHYGGGENGHWGIIDGKGNWLADPIFEYIGYEFANGRFIFESSVGFEDPLEGVYDTKQKRIVIEPQYSEIDFIEDGRLKVVTYDEESGKTIAKILDVDGNEVFCSEYKYIGCFSSYPYIYAQKEIEEKTKEGLLDKDGNVIVPFKYDVIRGGRELFDKRKYIFKKYGKLGLCDFDETLVLEPLYDDIRVCDNGLLIVKMRKGDDTVKGLITVNGKELLPVEYSDIIYVNNNTFVLSNDFGCKAVKYIKKK